MAVLNVYKPLGWTPLQAVERLRVLLPQYAQSVMTYAGRLDPMAEGVMLVLTDDDRYRRNEFLGLPKVYRATILFGYATDTYDALGIVTEGDVVNESAAERAMHNLQHTHTLSFPPYSGYLVKGKPLHWWAKQGRLHEVTIPTKTVDVRAVEDVAVGRRPALAVRATIEQTIARVQGDFRQEVCLQRWGEVLQGGEVIVGTFIAEVTGGTYIRALAHEMGKDLGCGALLLHLQRTRVGDYSSDAAVALV